MGNSPWGLRVGHPELDVTKHTSIEKENMSCDGYISLTVYFFTFILALATLSKLFFFFIFKQLYAFFLIFWFSSVQLLSHVQLFATPWTAARQASLSSFTVSQSLLKFMSIELVMLSNHLILCCPLLFLPSIFPSIKVFSNESALTSGGQSIGASASASVLPVNTQG